MALAGTGCVRASSQIREEPLTKPSAGYVNVANQAHFHTIGPHCSYAMMLTRLEAVETFKTQAKPLATPMWLGVASSSNDPMECLCFNQEGCFVNVAK